MDGRDLKLRRMAADVSAKALAEAMGTTPSQVSRWENSRRLTERARVRYLEALATFGTIPTVTVDSTEAS